MVGVGHVIGPAVRTMFLIIPSPQVSSYRFDDDVTGRQRRSYAQADRGTSLRLYAVDARRVTNEYAKIRSILTAAADQGYLQL